MRLVLAAAALCAAAAALPAHAAPSTCTAVAPGPRATCTYQSSGGTSEFTCLADFCTLSYGVAYTTQPFGTRMFFWTAYGDVVRLRAFGAGVANAGDSRFDVP